MTSQPPTSAPRETAQDSAGRILIVEESPLLREMLAGLLRAAGYEVVGLEDAQQAIDGVADIRPQLIFVNVNLPRIDGIMAAKVMRTILDDARLQIIFIARPSDLLDLKHLFEDAGDDYITLPVNHEELVGRVRRKFMQREAQDRETDQVRADTVGQLMITIAHHINNALTSIVARAHITRTDDPEDVEALLDLVQRQSKRIQSVVESLIEMSKSREMETTEYTSGGGQPMFDIARRLEDKVQ